MKLEPEDEYTHSPGTESNFNESMYFNLYDPLERLGGFFRIGNRVNEGYAEVTVCIFMPDGKVAFTYSRPKITTNDDLHGAGLMIEVVKPLEELRVTFEGELTILEQPLDMADPKRAFEQNPLVKCAIALCYRGSAPAFGGEPEVSHEAPGEEFAKAHYEQLVTATGSVTVGGNVWSVSGYGLRDHSWGPRSWQAPWYYRWLVGNGAGFGFMASRVARRDSGGSQGGFFWDGTELHLCDRCTVKSTWSDVTSYHSSVDVLLGRAGQEWHIRGKVINLIPLRNRRDGMVTRIAEGLTEWTLSDGRCAYGLSEYLDQIIDGRPVGFDE
ncbi:MAG: hypothetical protein M1115_00775 [Actinobacteria bacterium]|nr:hypothetical protein [Actinomycetota bacterium]